MRDAPGTPNRKHSMPTKTKTSSKRIAAARSSLARGSDFVRERRYIVVKISDAKKHLTPTELGILELVARKTALERRVTGKPDLQCVVVERDWPEYEPTWMAIEARMTRKPERDFDHEKAHARDGYPDNR